MHGGSPLGTVHLLSTGRDSIHFLPDLHLSADLLFVLHDGRTYESSDHCTDSIYLLANLPL